MPYEVREQDGKFCVYKKDNGDTLGCHGSRDEAEAQIAAIHANEGKQFDTGPLRQWGVTLYWEGLFGPTQQTDVVEAHTEDEAVLYFFSLHPELQEFIDQNGRVVARPLGERSSPQPEAKFGMTTKPAELEACVSGVLGDADFEPQAGRTREESAYAICNAQLGKAIEGWWADPELRKVVLEEYKFLEGDQEGPLATEQWRVSMLAVYEAEGLLSGAIDQLELHYTMPGIWDSEEEAIRQFEINFGHAWRLLRIISLARMGLASAPQTEGKASGWIVTVVARDRSSGQVLEDTYIVPFHIAQFSDLAEAEGRSRFLMNHGTEGEWEFYSVSATPETGLSTPQTEGKLMSTWHVTLHLANGDTFDAGVTATNGEETCMLAESLMVDEFLPRLDVEPGAARVVACDPRPAVEFSKTAHGGTLEVARGERDRAREKVREAEEHLSSAQAELETAQAELQAAEARQTETQGQLESSLADFAKAAHGDHQWRVSLAARNETTGEEAEEAYYVPTSIAEDENEAVDEAVARFELSHSNRPGIWDFRLMEAILV